MALTGLLVSPDFLFRVEHSNGRVSDLELASRLSFFLWSSIPDEQLLQIAERDKLHDPAMLRQQTLRMLSDPKSQALLDNFAGQWLHLRNIAEWHPDPMKYPQFDDALRNAFERESSLFFENIVREDRSVLELIVNINVNLDNTLVLNTRADDNPFYFGKVFASGNVHISGLTQNINIDISHAITEKNTSISIPLYM